MAKRCKNPHWGSMKIRWETDFEPAQWELLLKSMRIKDDSHALQIMASKTEQSKQLRTWVGQYAGTRYVPTQVLEYSGLKRAIDSKFLSGWGAE